ncbi:hypothetical protein [Bacillus sp. AFS037270]|uniref:hypothetical protein n=1 Tax=Bacillus sp. AFS037270 TaxID=2033499 RepID=UPI000BFCEBB4|nr:hypothetical protein [Bacillus sp. AFS037270]PGV52471.1 hypothetical protein COD92_09735 [Bacillus sp. AFS037270]
MKLDQLKTEVTTIVKELVKKADAIQAFNEAIHTAQAESQKAVEELEAQLAELKNEVTTATDIQTAKKAQVRAEMLEKDVELQKVVNNSILNNKKAELTELFEEFITVYKEAKPFYGVLDKEIAFNMSIKTYEADVELLETLSTQAYNALQIAKGVLVEQGIVTHADNLYKGFHLRQSEMGLNGIYRDVAYELKPFKARFK